MSLRIIIADDHPVVRIGTRAVIESSGVGRVVGEADSAQALMALLGSQPCDLLVTDYSMPGSPQADGFAMIGMIRRRHPDLPVLMLSVSNNLAILRMVLDSGVLGLVDKSSSMDELPQAIQAVYRGQPYISRSLRERVEAAGSWLGRGGGRRKATVATRGGGAAAAGHRHDREGNLAAAAQERQHHQPAEG